MTSFCFRMFAFFSLRCHAGLADLTKRFRPNLVVRGKRCNAFSEDKWKNICIGSCPFEVRKTLPACGHPKEISSLLLTIKLCSDQAKAKILFDVCRLLPPANEVFGKVIFSGACVKNSVHGGGGWYPSMHCRWYPRMSCTGGSPGPHPRVKLRGLAWGGLQAHTLRGSPSPLLGGCIPACTEAGTPPPNGYCWGGTHPTGMHSYSLIFFACSLIFFAFAFAWSE